MYKPKTKLATLKDHNELKNFLKSQLQNSNQENTIDYMSNSLKDSYSNY